MLIFGGKVRPMAVSRLTLIYACGTTRPVSIYLQTLVWNSNSNWAVQATPFACKNLKSTIVMVGTIRLTLLTAPQNQHSVEYRMIFWDLPTVCVKVTAKPKIYVCVENFEYGRIAKNMLFHVEWACFRWRGWLIIRVRMHDNYPPVSPVSDQVVIKQV